MKSLLIFALAIVVMIVGVRSMNHGGESGFMLLGAGLAIFLVGAVVNHGEHTRRGK